MFSTMKYGGVLMAAAVVAGCGEQSPLGPGALSPHAVAQYASVAAGPQPIDVSGEWQWTREEILTIPADFAFIFGFQPEGPVTHFRCEVEGLITLIQSGTTLSGVETETGSRCETQGGQVNTQPGLGVPIPIPEGRVVGRTVHLTVGDPVLFCPIHARVQAADDGTAASLSGTGRCVIPGHPQSQAPEDSPLDLDPPPAGTEKILTWKAVRLF